MRDPAHGSARSGVGAPLAGHLPAPATTGMDSPTPPPTRLLPSLRTDGFCQGRLGVYMNHARLTGSGCPTDIDGLNRFRESNILVRRVEGGHLHFHPHTGGEKPKFSDPALSPRESGPWWLVKPPGSRFRRLAVALVDPVSTLANCTLIA